MGALVIDRNFKGSLTEDINDYPEGIIVVVDKPYRWTSADVVRKLKFAAIHHFQKKNLKVGHAGTLDPLATGVLILCIGNACKQAQALQDSDKEYVAGVCFGATTPSYDLEKEIDRYCPLDGVTPEAIRDMLPKFIGEQNQVAPLFSAKQVDGVRAYELARKMFKRSEPLDTAARDLLNVSRIRINDVSLTGMSVTGNGEDSAVDAPAAGRINATGTTGASGRINVAAIPAGLPVATIRISCSKGTYIRALARDMGESLGSGAFLTALTRASSGGHTVEDALDLESILSLFNRHSRHCQD